MLIVAGTVAVKPERREDAIRAARAVAEATRAEAGCVTYDFWAHLTDPGTFHVFEIWESEEALARHFQTEHMRIFREQIGGLVAGPLSLRRYAVASVASM